MEPNEPITFIADSIQPITYDDSDNYGLKIKTGLYSADALSKLFKRNKGVTYKITIEIQANEK